MSDFATTSGFKDRVKQFLYNSDCMVFFQASTARLFQIPICRYREHRKIDQTTVGHVFGSGQSNTENLSIINERDITIACNHAMGVLGCWDIVVVERIEEDEFSLKQLELISTIQAKRIIIKNNYPYNIIKMMKKLWKLRSYKNAEILLETQVTPVNLCTQMHSFLDNKTCCLPQYASSIMTAALILVRLGVKKIYVHGADSLHYSSIRGGNPHETESYVLPFSSVFEYLQNELYNRGIKIQLAGQMK